MQVQSTSFSPNFDFLARLPAEDVATAVIAKLDGPAAAAFGRLLAEYVRLEESPVQGAFLHQLVEPTLELLSRPSQADQAAEQPNGRKPAGAYLEWLKVVDRLIRQHGGAPSFEELAVEFGLPHRAGARWRALQLLAAGLVDWQPGRCRTLNLTQAGQTALRAAR